jgi:hypothetical protein
MQTMEDNIDDNNATKVTNGNADDNNTAADVYATTKTTR